MIYTIYICNIFMQHICKVLGNKFLPLASLVLIIAYWTLGLALPSPGNILAADKVSNCISPD